MGKRVLEFAVIGIMIIFVVSGALAGAFNWQMAKGQTISVLLNQHMYTTDLLTHLATFEALTGIHVNYTVIPEENYFDKLTMYLSSKSGEPDVFMTGAYQIWDYAPPGYLQNLDEFVYNPEYTSPDYDINDFFPGIIGADRWDLLPGHPVGTGPLWAIPQGFEIYTLAYNKKAFEEAGVEPPTATTTVDQLIEIAKKMQGWGGPGTYGIAVRGTRNWATIHPAYMTNFRDYGATDMVLKGGKLVATLNSPQAIEATEKFAELIKEGGSPNWSNDTWYQCQADLGAGKAAMMWDADLATYPMNVKGASKVAGDLAWVPSPLPAGKKIIHSNIWVWSLAMNAYSKHKIAAWLFIQYFTGKQYQLWEAVNANGVDPARASVFNDPAFQKRMEMFPGYLSAFKTEIDNAAIQFTPEPDFIEIATDWAATLQGIVFGNYPSVQVAMNDLNNKVNSILDSNINNRMSYYEALSKKVMEQDEKYRSGQ